MFHGDLHCLLKHTVNIIEWVTGPVHDVVKHRLSFDDKTKHRLYLLVESQRKDRNDYVLSN